MSTRSRAASDARLLGAGRRAHGCDAQLFADIAARSSPAGDAVLPLLTRLADHSKLWIGIAALLAATGHRRGRRAAGRGIGSIAVASLLANQVGKRLLPRARPPLGLVPVARLAHRIPTSASFPSGHAASAAAFAVGTSIEMPELAVPLGLLAGAVGYSRIYTGVHYPGDVLAGLALGAGSAAALTRLVPTSSVAGRNAMPPPAVAQPPRPTGAGVVMVVNPASREGRGARIVEAVRAALPDARIEAGGGDGDGPTLSEALSRAADEAEVLAIGGGDGTVNAAASVALETGLPLLVVPAGTLNHFAGDLGIDGVHDALAAVRSGSAVSVRVGRVAGEIFLNTASLGGYPAFVQVRERWERRVGKPVAAALAVRRVRRDEDVIEMDVAGRRRRVGLMFVGNGGYEPRGFAPQWRPTLDCPCLDVRLFEVSGRLPLARLAVELLLGRVRRSPAYVEMRTDSLTVRLPGPGLLARDGEIGPCPATLEFTVDPRRLTVFGPTFGSPVSERASEP